MRLQGGEGRREVLSRFVTIVGAQREDDLIAGRYHDLANIDPQGYPGAARSRGEIARDANIEVVGAVCKKGGARHPEGHCAAAERPKSINNLLRSC